MKCQICHKNEANIVFTQIVNNEKVVMQICSECAQSKGLTIAYPKKDKDHIESLVGSLGDNQSEKHSDDTPDISCSVCGLSFTEFKKSGLFGCNNCVDAFGEHVEKILKQIHGATRHEGKEPGETSSSVSVNRELRILRDRLRKCVEREQYEMAAEIRDQINVLEQERTAE